MIFEGLPYAPSTAHGARSAAASRVSTRRMSRAFIFPRVAVDLNFNGCGPQS